MSESMRIPLTSLLIISNLQNQNPIFFLFLTHALPHLKASQLANFCFCFALSFIALYCLYCILCSSIFFCYHYKLYFFFVFLIGIDYIQFLCRVEKMSFFYQVDVTERKHHYVKNLEFTNCVQCSSVSSSTSMKVGNVYINGYFFY